MSKLEFEPSATLEATQAGSPSGTSAPSDAAAPGTGSSEGGLRPKKQDCYAGMPLEINMYSEEKQFSYEGYPSWVAKAAAVAKLFREGKPFLPTLEERPSRIEQAKRLAPFKKMTPPQLEKMSAQNLPGCFFGLTFPKTAEEMMSEEFGAEWLTKAFHAAGTLPKDNRVIKLLRAQPLPVKGFDAAGGAAMKMFLTVEYLKPDPELHTELFCKYPYLYKDFPVERREVSLYYDGDGPEVDVQMRLTHLFPFRTAKFYFGEVCRETANFILISETIPYSRRGKVENGKVVEKIDYEPYQILPVCGKYQDWLLPDPAEYYCCLFRALGRLAAWDKQGRYDDYFEPAPVFNEEQYLAFTLPQRQKKNSKLRQLEQQGAAKICDVAIKFMTKEVNNLMPAEMLDIKNLQRIKDELVEMTPYFTDMSDFYQRSNSDYVAAMHANLQADNAFFWRDEYGDLECGVLDWGSFDRAPFCLRFLGCLSGADPQIMMAHEEGIIRCFRDEYHRCGGPDLPLEELLLRYHLAYISFVYESCTWIERDIHKHMTPAELADMTGVLDERFQAAFRVRCRGMTIINAWTYYHMRGNHYKATFDKWAAGKGARFLTEFT